MDDSFKGELMNDVQCFSGRKHVGLFAYYLLLCVILISSYEK